MEIHGFSGNTPFYKLSSTPSPFVHKEYWLWRSADHQKRLPLKRALPLAINSNLVLFVRLHFKPTRFVPSIYLRVPVRTHTPHLLCTTPAIRIELESLADLKPYWWLESLFTSKFWSSLCFVLGLPMAQVIYNYFYYLPIQTATIATMEARGAAPAAREWIKQLQEQWILLNALLDGASHVQKVR